MEVAVRLDRTGASRSRSTGSCATPSSTAGCAGTRLWLAGVPPPSNALLASVCRFALTHGSIRICRGSCAALREAGAGSARGHVDERMLSEGWPRARLVLWRSRSWVVR
jgi:hypothetical protein